MNKYQCFLMVIAMPYVLVAMDLSDSLPRRGHYHRHHTYPARQHAHHRSRHVSFQMHPTHRHYSHGDSSSSSYRHRTFRSAPRSAVPVVAAVLRQRAQASDQENVNKLLEYAKAHGITRWIDVDHTEGMKKFLRTELQKLAQDQKDVFSQVVVLLPADNKIRVDSLIISLFRLAIKSVQRVATKLKEGIEEMEQDIEKNQNDMENEILVRDHKIKDKIAVENEYEKRFNEYTEQIADLKRNLAVYRDEFLRRDDCCLMGSCYWGCFSRPRLPALPEIDRECPISEADIL